jgi:hypothetical protein
VIAVRSDCYVAGGDPRYWRHDPAEYTLTTAAASYSNFAEWIIKTGHAGRYHVDVKLDGGAVGQSKAAQYQVAHAGTVDTVAVDQTSATGYVTLGDFDFAGTGDEHVLLGDNTGEASSTNTQLYFDAVRVESLTAAADSGCGCRSGGGTAAGIGLALLALRRRRR